MAAARLKVRIGAHMDAVLTAEGQALVVVGHLEAPMEGQEAAMVVSRQASAAVARVVEESIQPPPIEVAEPPQQPNVKKAEVEAKVSAKPAAKKAAGAPGTKRPRDVYEYLDIIEEKLYATGVPVQLRRLGNMVPRPKALRSGHLKALLWKNPGRFLVDLQGCVSTNYSKRRRRHPVALKRDEVER